MRGAGSIISIFFATAGLLAGGGEGLAQKKGEEGKETAGKTAVARFTLVQAKTEKGIDKRLVLSFAGGVDSDGLGTAGSDLHRKQQGKPGKQCEARFCLEITLVSPAEEADTLIFIAVSYPGWEELPGGPASFVPDAFTARDAKGISQHVVHEGGEVEPNVVFGAAATRAGKVFSYVVTQNDQTVKVLFHHQKKVAELATVKLNKGIKLTWKP